MKNFIISITAIILLTSCQKHNRIQPSGHLVTYDILLSELFPKDFGPITGIDIYDMKADLYIHISEDEEETLSITVDDNVFPHILINGSGFGVSSTKKYSISMSYHHTTFMIRQPTLSIVLTVRNFERLGLSGASTAYLLDTLVADNLDLRLSGASRFRTAHPHRREATGRIEANTITAVLSGASILDMSGRCETLDLTLSGASQAVNFSMVCDHLKAVFSGASRASVTVNSTLSATLSGASVLNYGGNPVIIHSNLSGASVLRQW